MIRWTALPLAIMSAACMTPSEPEPTTPGNRTSDDPQAGTCNAAPAQVHLGKMASDEIGALILAESNARSLRWGPPNTAWTMDYREDRVNVRYDEAMIITAITCG